jgi:hypothetical protein
MALTCQVTAVLVAFLTVAANFWVPAPGWRSTKSGLTVTNTWPADAARVSVAEPDCEGSADNTAVTVTVAGEGIAAGDT